MPVPISTRAKKYLTDTAHYTSLEEDDLGWTERVNLAPDENLIGLYENRPGAFEQSIVITTLGLHVFKNLDYTFIDYNNIQRSEWLTTEKTMLLENPLSRRLVLSLPSGAFDLPITGSPRIPVLDLASFHTFLLGVNQTLRIIAEKAAAKE